MNEPRPRCTSCSRRVPRSGHSSTRRDGVESVYCHRVACRRAWYEATGGAAPAPAYASDEARGAALIAADYVAWPWWARLVPQSARGEAAARIARLTAAAVERRVREEIGGEADA